jgi:hypothetical protein
MKNIKKISSSATLDITRDRPSNAIKAAATLLKNNELNIVKDGIWINYCLSFEDMLLIFYMKVTLVRQLSGIYVKHTKFVPPAYD